MNDSILAAAPRAAALAVLLAGLACAGCGRKDDTPKTGSAPPAAVGSSAPAPAPMATPAPVPAATAVTPAASTVPGTLPELGSTTAGNPAEQGVASAPRK